MCNMIFITLVLQMDLRRLKINNYYPIKYTFVKKLFDHIYGYKTVVLSL